MKVTSRHMLLSFHPWLDDSLSPCTYWLKTGLLCGESCMPLSAVLSLPLSPECLWEQNTSGIKWQQRQIYWGIQLWVHAESFSISLARCSMSSLNAESLSLSIALLNHHRWIVSVIFLDKHSDGKHGVCIGGRELGYLWRTEENNSFVASWQKKISQFHICQLRIIGLARSNISINFLIYCVSRFSFFGWFFFFGLPRKETSRQTLEDM